MPFQDDEPEQLNIIEEIRKMDQNDKAKKPRKRKHPPINIYHVIKFSSDANYDAHQFNMLMNEKYGYNFSLAQLKLYIKKINADVLTPMGVKNIQLNSNRASAATAEYNKKAVMDMLEAGKLELATKPSDLTQEKKPRAQKKPATKAY